MPEIFIPAAVTVHLGEPEQVARDLTLPFSDYICTAASCELNPYAHENALRAAITVIVSFALNRFHSRFYRSRGYPFDITASRRDLIFWENRHAFEPIAALTDSLFNDALFKTGTPLPLAASFRPEGTPFFSLEEAHRLAAQGLNARQVLSALLGNDLHLTENLPVQGCPVAFSGTTLSAGMSGKSVRSLQTLLNRLSSYYPGIPRISPPTGTFSPDTEAAVRRFQEIFSLNPTGQVDKTAWYRLYFKARRLKMRSAPPRKPQLVAHSSPEKITPFKLPYYIVAASERSPLVCILQTLLVTLSDTYTNFPRLAVTGEMDAATRSAVQFFQTVSSLPPTGNVDRATWDMLARAFDSL